MTDDRRTAHAIRQNICLKSHKQVRQQDANQPCVLLTQESHLKIASNTFHLFAGYTEMIRSSLKTEDTEALRRQRANQVRKKASFIRTVSITLPHFNIQLISRLLQHIMKQQKNSYLCSLKTHQSGGVKILYIHNVSKKHVVPYFIA